MSKKIEIHLKSTSQKYDINIGNNLLETCGDYARKTLPGAVEKIVIVTNQKVFSLYGMQVAESLKRAKFEVAVCKIGDGEKYKSFATLEKTLRRLSENKLKRSDAVIALGGGVIGDLAGFASAVYLRGISFIQIPTTLLAMIDSSVGGKTGVNTAFGKNLVGAFHQPAGVLVDVGTLQTLPRRELTAGFCESVKQGAIADKKLFSRTAEFLKNYSPHKFRTYFSDADFLEQTEELIAAQVSFKAEIVCGDATENLDRNDSRARKILNFGHTAAHALEKVTDYEYFKHGEAVGYGILIAAEISKNVANFVDNDLQLLNDVVASAGSLPPCKNIVPEEVIKAFAFDKKNVGNNLQWILLKQIGKPVITASNDIPQRVILHSIKKVLEK